MITRRSMLGTLGAIGSSLLLPTKLFSMGSKEKVTTPEKAYKGDHPSFIRLFKLGREGIPATFDDIRRAMTMIIHHLKEQRELPSKKLSMDIIRLSQGGYGGAFGDIGGHRMYDYGHIDKVEYTQAGWEENKRLLVGIGSEERPATSEDIADIERQLAATADDPDLTIVTHHLFHMDFEDYDGGPWYRVGKSINEIRSDTLRLRRHDSV